MHSFRDNTGQTWTLQLTYQALQKVRAVTGHSLVARELTNLFRTLDDPLSLTQILAVCLEEQMLDRRIDEGQLFGLLNTAFAGARLALLEQIASFAESLDLQKAIRAAIAKKPKLEAQFERLVLTQFESLNDDRVVAEVEAEIQAIAKAILAQKETETGSTSNDSSGSSPEKSESTPDRTPSDNSAPSPNTTAASSGTTPPA